MKNSMKTTPTAMISFLRDEMTNTREKLKKYVSGYLQKRDQKRDTIKNGQERVREAWKKRYAEMNQEIDVCKYDSIKSFKLAKKEKELRIQEATASLKMAAFRNVKRANTLEDERVAMSRKIDKFNQKLAELRHKIKSQQRLLRQSTEVYRSQNIPVPDQDSTVEVLNLDTREVTTMTSSDLIHYMSSEENNSLSAHCSEDVERLPIGEFTIKFHGRTFECLRDGNTMVFFSK